MDVLQHRPVAQPLPVEAPSSVSRRTFFRSAGSVAAVTLAVGVAGGARWAFSGSDRSDSVAAGAVRAAAGIKPNASNTGVLPGSTLTRYDGNMVVTTAGAVIQNMDIRGTIAVRANNVTIRNCFVRGGAVGVTGGSVSMIMQYNKAVTGLLVEDCTIVPQSPTQYTGGIQGSGMTVRRCDVSNGVDGINAMNSNVLVDSCYVHDGAYYTPSVGHSDNQSHDDGAQITNGTNIVYTNNTMTSYYMSCFMIGQLQGPLTGLKIMNNWVDGGSAQINVNSANFGPMAPVITGNRFGRSRPVSYQILSTGQVDLTHVTGNVWDDNGQPVKIMVK